MDGRAGIADEEVNTAYGGSRIAHTTSVPDAVRNDEHTNG
jgi:hypothetical protein